MLIAVVATALKLVVLCWHLIVTARTTPTRAHSPSAARSAGNRSSTTSPLSASRTAA
jgi:hypothetical protein